jgi:hypothetical protein
MKNMQRIVMTSLKYELVIRKKNIKFVYGNFILNDLVLKISGGDECKYQASMNIATIS